MASPWKLSRQTVAGVAATLATVAAIMAPVAGGQATVRSSYALANRCFALRASTGRYVGLSRAHAYTASAARLTAAIPLYLKPTGLGTYMLYDRGAGLLAEAHGAVARARKPGPSAQWRIAPARGGTFTVTSTAAHRRLETSRSGALMLGPGRASGPAARFTFPADHRCRRFPEAQVGAQGPARSSVNKNGTVFGWADLEFHLTASFRAGGEVIDGQDFNPFGITVALSAAHDKQEHGPDGSLDVTGNLLRFGTPVGRTNIHGWSTF